MALRRTVDMWSTWLDDLGFTDEEKKVYSSALAREAIMKTDLPEFNHELLVSCDIPKYGHRTRIIRKACGSTVQATTTSSSAHGSDKACAIPRPSIHKGATQLEFEQFIHEWGQFKKHYNLLNKEQVETQLTFCCAKEIRGKICEIRQPNVIYEEEELLNIIKDLCLSKVSRMTHIQKFHTVKQEVSESCEDFYSRLHTMATCCKFACVHCGKSTSKQRVREKFVLGIRDKNLQTTLLRTDTHQPNTPLEKLLEEAITLEQSVREQIAISSNLGGGSDMIQNINVYSDEEQSETTEEDPSANSLRFKQRTKDRKQISRKGFPQCSRCGTRTHAVYTTSQRCTAWGKICRNCGGKNHFAKMCQQKSKNSIQPNSGSSAQQIEMSCLSIENTTSSFITINVQHVGREISSQIKAFPDTGANLCLLGPKELKDLKISIKDLEQCKLSVTVAGGSHITATGFCQLKLTLGERESKTTAYYCNKADRFYIKQQSCKELGIIPM